MCLNCENEKAGELEEEEDEEEEEEVGAVVKVGEGAWSSHAGGIVFYAAELENISEKMCGRV